jgi:GT2 family glycosyltransferase
VSSALAPTQISVVIPTFIGGETLRQCLHSLAVQDVAEKPEIVVVLDGPQANQPDVANDTISTTFVRNTENLGFSAAVNRGIRQAHSAWVLVLNDDTSAPPNLLGELGQAANKGYDSIATKVVLTGTGRVDSAGIVVHGDGGSEERLRGRDAESDIANQPAEVFGPSGAGALYSQRLLQSTGGFDERFFAYFEDVDLAWRARLLGFRCLYWPGAWLNHIHSASWGRVSEKKLYLLERNRLWTLWKNYPTSYCFLSPGHRAVNLVRLLGSSYLNEEARAGIRTVGAIRLGRIQLAAYRNAAERLASIWRERYRVSRLGRVSVARTWVDNPGRMVRHVGKVPSELGPI